MKPRMGPLTFSPSPPGFRPMSIAIVHSTRQRPALKRKAIRVPCLKAMSSSCPTSPPIMWTSRVEPTSSGVAMTSTLVRWTVGAVSKNSRSRRRCARARWPTPVRRAWPCGRRWPASWSLGWSSRPPELGVARVPHRVLEPGGPSRFNRDRPPTARSPPTVCSSDGSGGRSCLPHSHKNRYSPSHVIVMWLVPRCA